MLLKLLKGFQPANLILIIFITIIFWLKVFLDDTNSGIYIDQNPLPLYGFLMNFFSSLNIPFLNKMIALLLVLLQTVLLTTINNHFNLLGYRSYMPALLYILITINFTDYLKIHPVYFANILFLIAWIKMKKAQGKQKALANYFDASILIGLASLFYFNFIYLSLILWANISISRPGNFKEYGLAIAGLLVVWYLFISSYFILNDTGIDLFAYFSFSPEITEISLLSTTTLIAGIFFLILIFLANLSLFKYYNSLNINIRNNLKLFFYLFVLGIIIILFTNSSFELIYLIAIPISLFLSLFFINLKRFLLGNVLLIIVFLITILNLFFADRLV